MVLKTLWLKNLRSFVAGHVVLQKDLTVFVGQNRTVNHKPIFSRRPNADSASLLQVALSTAVGFQASAAE
jgi:hypothetical protein